MADLFLAAILLAAGIGAGIAIGLHWGHQRGWNDALTTFRRSGFLRDNDAGVHG